MDGYSVVTDSAFQQCPTSPSFATFKCSALLLQPVGFAIVGQSVDVAVFVPDISDGSGAGAEEDARIAVELFSLDIMLVCVVVCGVVGEVQLSKMYFCGNLRCISLQKQSPLQSPQRSARNNRGQQNHTRIDHKFDFVFGYAPSKPLKDGVQVVLSCAVGTARVEQTAVTNHPRY